MTTYYCGMRKAYGWLWLVILRQWLNISSAGYGLQTIRQLVVAHGGGSGL